MNAHQRLMNAAHLRHAIDLLNSAAEDITDRRDAAAASAMARAQKSIAAVAARVEDTVWNPATPLHPDTRVDDDARRTAGRIAEVEAYLATGLSNDDDVAISVSPTGQTIQLEVRTIAEVDFYRFGTAGRAATIINHYTGPARSDYRVVKPFGPIR